jgi:hypothetical protein
MSSVRLQILRQQSATEQAEVESVRLMMQNAARSWSAWRSTNPLKPVVTTTDVVCDTEPGVYIAGPSCDIDMRCYWDGRNWSAHWALNTAPDVITYCKTTLRSFYGDIKWLSLVESGKSPVWKSTAPPEPGVYVASRYRAHNVRGYWDGHNWSLGWLVGAPASEIAFRKKTSQQDNTGIMWLCLEVQK